MSAENNGGKTGYYDLPLPDKEAIYEVIETLTTGSGFSLSDADIDEAVTRIQALCPQTLNDLIEYKEMPFWRGEIFKATYALQERAKKSKVYSVVRELNKIIYYAGRGLAIAMREQK